MVAMDGGKGVGMAGGPGDIREGAKPPFREISNRNPLDAVQLLIEAGAKVNAKTPEGDSALHFAAFDGKIDVVRALAKDGADLSLKDGAALPRCRSSRSNRLVRRRRFRRARPVRSKGPTHGGRGGAARAHAGQRSGEYRRESVAVRTWVYVAGVGVVAAAAAVFFATHHGPKPRSASNGPCCIATARTVITTRISPRTCRSTSGHPTTSTPIPRVGKGAAQAPDRRHAAARPTAARAEARARFIDALTGRSTPRRGQSVCRQHEGASAESGGVRERGSRSARRRGGPCGSPAERWRRLRLR